MWCIIKKSVGETKNLISAKAHNLDHTGRLETVTDLHSTIADFAAIITFITKEATKSELWKMVIKLHDIWLDTNG
jgi:hypothetical protein